MFDYMPVQASNWAEGIDWINNIITDISVICTLGITGVMVYFALKYRRKSENEKTPYITHNAAIETVWTVVPTIICIGIFWYGFAVYKEMREPPANALEINVDAYSWRWEFTYPNGKRSTNELVLPVGRAVKLIMTSHDVLHSFFIPAMRVKEDVIANNYSYLWFEPTIVGDFRIFCTEYCGLNHSAMLASLKVVSQEQYDDYLLNRTEGEKEALTPLQLGEKLYTDKGCKQCHSIDGSKLIGPSLKGVFGKEELLADGSKIKVDENYIRESLVNPMAKIVQGYPPVMTSFEGQLTDDEIAGIIAYLKSL